MNTTYLTRVRKLFASGDKRVDRHNQRQWLRSVKYLGSKWLLHPANMKGKV